MSVTMTQEVMLKNKKIGKIKIEGNLLKRRTAKAIQNAWSIRDHFQMIEVIMMRQSDTIRDITTHKENKNIMKENDTSTS